MSQIDHDYSTVNITPQLVSQIVDVLKNKAWGSVEIYVENYSVTQITERTITKVKKSFSAKKLPLFKKQNKSKYYSSDLRSGD